MDRPTIVPRRCDRLGLRVILTMLLPLLFLFAAPLRSVTVQQASAACAALAPSSPFAFPGFQSQWQQGERLAPNFWGPSVTVGMQEPYTEAAGGKRLVQYFDKGRMELINPDTGTITNGLLASELITGQLQIGDDAFQPRTPAAIPIAGDPDNTGPTYATLGTTAASLLTPTEYVEPGTMVTASVMANGAIVPGNATTGSGPTAIAVYDNETEHNVPQAFADYRDSVGILTIGYATSEPFFTVVKVGGRQKQVMVQVFERRVLTYTADNPDAFKVEMGNIGQHYYQWRYCAG